MAEKVLATSKGMGFEEIVKACAPKKFRRACWKPDEYVYFEKNPDHDETEFVLHDERGEPWFISSEHILATDWEIVK